MNCITFLSRVGALKFGLKTFFRSFKLSDDTFDGCSGNTHVSLGKPTKGDNSGRNISFLVDSANEYSLVWLSNKVKKTLLVRHEVQAVIFDDADNAKKVLILKKIDFSAKRYRWRLLKGGMNDGETETEALLREVFEETGLKNVKILDKVHKYEFVFKSVKHIVSSYLVRAESVEPIKLQKAEVADYVWTTKEKALQMLHWDNEKEAVRQLK